MLHSIIDKAEAAQEVYRSTYKSNAGELLTARRKLILALGRAVEELTDGDFTSIGNDEL